MLILFTYTNKKIPVKYYFTGIYLLIEAERQGTIIFLISSLYTALYLFGFIQVHRIIYRIGLFRKFTFLH